ncbi:RagB/SusD family nutrient uptake outer membrane protein [Marinoscillum sp.]|uniref:RagB/SusD family nutrient uptake outer membrane protein n=1 Tax=Marinoscillum sp. TaxID=2024838 RepID=UPI003BAD9FF1
MKFLKILTIASLLITTSCDLEIQPENKSTIDNLLAEDGGIETATNGNYALLKDVLAFGGAGPNSNNDYTRHLYQMSEFAADNVMYTQFSSDPLYLVFTREHVPGQLNSAYFWFIAYRMILGTNLIINNAEEGVDGRTDQLIGENYFLRAMASFDLLRFFAKSYNQGRDNPGIVLRTTASEPTLEARATVGESYDQVVADLLKAEALMTEDNDRGVEYASKLAAQALLCRVYLYMENYEKVIEYADKVEASGIRLATNSEYLDNFANTPSSAESIFVIKWTLQDHRGKNGSIGSMYYDDGNNNGWGEVFASQTFRDLIETHPEDIRNDLIVSPGGTKNGYPIHYIIKFSGQDGVVNLCSPQYLRYSEVVLNRAEANAHLSNDAAAIADVNDIRVRAGLSGAALYDETDLGGKTVLDVVLEERRLELAYEGHRGFDLVRNQRDLVRNYEGIHQENGDTRVSIPYDDDRWIFYIPLQELTINSLVRQNP